MLRTTSQSVGRVFWSRADSRHRFGASQILAKDVAERACAVRLGRAEGIAMFVLYLCADVTYDYKIMTRNQAITFAVMYSNESVWMGPDNGA
jgi:hypothetical protein